jgi:hypothetical protein
MALFTDADLDDFAALAEELAFKDNIEILRNVSSTPNGSGGGTGSAQVVATVLGLVRDYSTIDEQVVSQAQKGRVEKVILVPRNTDVRNTDQIRVGTTNYHVIEIGEPVTYDVVRRIFTRRKPA